MLERPVIEARCQGHVRDELVLHRHGLFPVGRPRQIRIELRGPDAWDAEVVVARRADLVELHVAVRIEDRAVAIEIGPRARVGLHAARIHGRGEAERLLPEELADRHLQRGLARAEQIVRRAEADRPVLPARDARHRRDVGPRRGRGRRDESPAGGGFRRRRRVEVVVPRAVGQRQPRERPAILRVDPETGVQILEPLERRIGQRDRARRRHAVDVDVGQRRRGAVADVLPLGP